MQDVIDWGFSLEIAVIQFLTERLNIPLYLIKLAAVFSVALLTCVFVWQFSWHLARKNLFTLDMKKYGDKGPSGIKRALGIAFYILKYLVIFPLYAIIWGAILVLFLTLLVSEGNYPDVVFFSTIVIAVIRAMAYLDEDFASDLAKTLPLVLLVTVMLNPQVLSKAAYTINLTSLLQYDIVYLSIGFIVGVEWVLRAVNGIRHKHGKGKPGEP